MTGGPDGGVDKSKIRRFTTTGMAPREASEICTTCHDRGTHALLAGSQHDQRNVGCPTCHSVHSPKAETQIKAATQPELCATCHRNIVNRLYRFNHMPVREGKMVCSSCHNPHGSANECFSRVKLWKRLCCGLCGQTKKDWRDKARHVSVLLVNQHLYQDVLEVTGHDRRPARGGGSS